MKILTMFFNILNNLHPNIRFKYEFKIDGSLAFLDLKTLYIEKKQPQYVLDIMTQYKIKKYYCNHYFVEQIPPRLSPRGMLRSHCVDLMK